MTSYFTILKVNPTTTLSQVVALLFQLVGPFFLKLKQQQHEYTHNGKTHLQPTIIKS